MRAGSKLRLPQERKRPRALAQRAIRSCRANLVLVVGYRRAIVHVRGAVMECNGVHVAAGDGCVVGMREVRRKDQSQGCQRNQTVLGSFVEVHDFLRSCVYDAPEVGLDS